jgi:hypothetical protein
MLVIWRPKSTSLRAACLKYLGIVIPWYVYGPANLVGRPRCVAFRGRCALVALPACSGHPGFYIENEGLPVGCAPSGPTKYLWVLGSFSLETSLRSACLEWLCQTLCSYAGYLDVSTLHTFKIYIFHGFVSDDSRYHNFSYDIVDNLFVLRTFQDSVGYSRILDINFRPLRGRYAYKASYSLLLC